MRSNISLDDIRRLTAVFDDSAADGSVTTSFDEPASQRRNRDWLELLVRKGWPYSAPIGISLVFVSSLIIAGWVSEYPISADIVVLTANIFRASAQSAVPINIVAVLMAVVIVAMAILIYRDISIRQKLQLSEEQYAQTVAVTHDGMWIWDIVNDEEYFSPRWGQILGYSQAEIQHERFKNFIYPDDLDRALQALRGHIGSKSPYDLEIRLLHKDDYHVWVRAKGQAAWDKDGNPIRMVASITEITDRMRAEDALHRSQGQIEAISDNSPSHIYAMDTESRLLMVNKSYQKFYGITNEDALSEGIITWLGADNAKLLLAADQKALTTGKPVELQMEVIFADGKKKSLQINRFPIFDNEYRIIGIGGVDNDISEQKVAEQRLVAAMLAAEGANRAKSEFVANMSHELRTPLNAIIGFSEIMAREFLGPIGLPKYHEYAGDINAAGTHLLGIINNMLDLSKIEAGMFELHEETIDVQQALDTCLTVVKGQAEKYGVEIETNALSNLPDLYADERNLKQILLNLLTNAIKFTPAGGKITIDIRSRHNEGYFFKVTDTGIGIAAEDIPMVLSPFGQVESAISRTQQGTGLGLPLTKSMVEMHGGSFDLQSTFGAGTTVTVRFPVERIIPQGRNGRFLMNPQDRAQEISVETVKATDFSDQPVESIPSA